MARPCPLYDDLVKQVEARKEKNIDIKRICTTITNISQTAPSDADAREHYDTIAALILHHEIINNGGIPLSANPYEGKIMIQGKGVLHTMMNLPPNLQQIIAQYVEDCSSSKASLIHS